MLFTSRFDFVSHLARDRTLHMHPIFANRRVSKSEANLLQAILVNRGTKMLDVQWLDSLAGEKRKI